MDFPKEVLFPQKTLFFKGAALRIAEECLQFGKRGLIVHGRSFEINGNKDIITHTFSQGASVECFCRGSGEPSLDEITEVINRAKSIGAEWIAGVGGGSVIDLAKAAAGLYNAEKNLSFYQEGGILESKGIPFIAVPTTAGSGAEATINAVIIDRRKGSKRSIRDESFLARKVILDAALLKGLPRTVMGYAAMDALVQGYESFVSKHATWFSESFALKAVSLINANIIPAYQTADEDSMSLLLLGSYCAGIALSSSRLGVIHGIAHPLGVLYNVPHGLVCSVCFLPSIRINREAMGKKYEILSNIIGKDLIERIEELIAALNIKSPFKGKAILEQEKIIEETLLSGSTAANPKPVNRQDVEYLLGEVFES